MAVSFTAPSGESDSEEGSEAETPSCSFVAPSGLTGAAPPHTGSRDVQLLGFQLPPQVLHSRQLPVGGGDPNTCSDAAGWRRYGQRRGRRRGE